MLKKCSTHLWMETMFTKYIFRVKLYFTTCPKITFEVVYMPQTNKMVELLVIVHISLLCSKRPT